MSSLNNVMDFNNKLSITIGLIIVIVIIYNLYYKNSDTEYGVLCESFGNLNQSLLPPHELMPDTCIAGIDYSCSNDILCRNWYNRNVLGVEHFSSNDFSQDTIINTIFSIDNIPLYNTPFKKIPDIADPSLTYRTSCYIMTSVDHIHRFMKSVFSKLKNIVDASTKSFDPFIATCSIQITISSLLFEIYRNIANSFFSLVCNVESPPYEATVTFLYLMPFMMYLKRHIVSLMEGAMIVLTKNDKTNNYMLVDVSTINPNVYNNVRTQIETEISTIFSPSLIQNTNEEDLISKCINSKYTSEFNEYRTIVVSALTSVLSLCRSKVKTIDSLTTNNHVIQTIINGDLIHVFYRAVLYYTEVLNMLCDNTYTKNDKILKHYEYETRQLMTTATQTPVFTQTNNKLNVSIDTALSSFTSPQTLRIAMINIANSIDVKNLNILAKYTPPDRLGTLFMQLLNSKSEILAMPINQAKDYIVDYITSLSDSYLQSLYDSKTKSYEQTSSNTMSKSEQQRFTIGNSINTCLQKKKQNINSNKRNNGNVEMFGDYEFNTGTLKGSCVCPNNVSQGTQPQGTSTQTPQSQTSLQGEYNRSQGLNQSMSQGMIQYYYDSNGNTVKDSNGRLVVLSAYLKHSYDTSQKYLLDDDNKFIIDSTGNPILSCDYISASLKNGSAAYVPVLDAPYPVLQSQLGKASYDIRGIPDTPLSFAPISGLPGRPVV